MVWLVAWVHGYMYAFVYGIEFIWNINSNASVQHARMAQVQASIVLLLVM